MHVGGECQPVARVVVTRCAERVDVRGLNQRLARRQQDAQSGGGAAPVVCLGHHPAKRRVEHPGGGRLTGLGGLGEVPQGVFVAAAGGAQIDNDAWYLAIRY